jgi:hypothetical protein
MMEYACQREHAVVLVGYRRGNCSDMGACGSGSSCEMMDGVGTLGGSCSVTADTLGGGAAVGTLVGAIDYVGTLGGGVLIGVVGGAVMRLDISASLVMADIVLLETLWKGAGGGRLCRIIFRFIAAMVMRYVWVSVGVSHFIGNNSTLSDIHSLPVSVTYTL